MQQRNADSSCLVDDGLGLENSGIEIIVLLVSKLHSCSLLLTDLVCLLKDLLVCSSCFSSLAASQILSRP